MDNDNNDELDAPGRSVFGDDQSLDDEELPTVSIEEGSSVFGDDASDASSSVFADGDDAEGQLSLGDESDSNSVFASGSSASLDDDPWDSATPDVVEVSGDSEVLIETGAAGAGEVLVESELPDGEDADVDVPDVDVPDVDVPDVGDVDVPDAPGDEALTAVTLDDWSTPDLSLIHI